MTERRFENFRAKTPNEMMLLNEVKRLQRVNQELMREKGIYPFKDFKRQTVDVSFEPPPELRLRRAVSVLGQIDEQGRLTVDARCNGSDRQLGLAYYVSQQDLMDSFALADVLMHQHETLIYEIAAKLAE